MLEDHLQKKQRKNKTEKKETGDSQYIKITNTNAFQKSIDESNSKPNKIWVDKGSKFFIR